MYQTTPIQFTYYKNFANEVFDTIKNNIVKSRVDCELRVLYSDYVRNFLGTNRFPNIVTIFIDNIVDCCGNPYNKNAIFSLIVQVITHELIHKEIVFSQQFYTEDKFYKMRLEDTVNYYALDILTRNRKCINQEFGFDLDLSYLETIIAGFEESTAREFRRANETELWLYSILENVVLRNNAKFKDIRDSILIPANDLVIWFNEKDNFMIKSDGVYCDQELARFAQYIGANIAQYDRYTVDIDGNFTYYRGKENVYILTLKFSKQGIYPILFGDGIYDR